MSKYAYFNPHDNGRILQWIDTEAREYNLPDASVLHLCTDAEWELQFSGGEHMVKDARIVSYVAPVHGLAAIKLERWNSIKAKRDALKAGGFKVGTLWFHSDADSRIQHLGLKDKARDLIAAGGAMVDNLTILGQPVRWKTMDGSFANVTAQLAFDIVAAVGDLDARLFAVAETHRAAMEAAADPAAYDFSASWPETFGG